MISWLNNFKVRCGYACILTCLCFTGINIEVVAQSAFPFAYKPLPDTGELTSAMVAGIDRFLDKENARVKEYRGRQWHYAFDSQKRFNSSVSAMRALLSERLGVVDKRVTPVMSVFTDGQLGALRLETTQCTVKAVNWQVLDRLHASGLLLQPRGKVLGRVVMIPDADMLPEVLAGIGDAGAPGFGAARQLANAGLEVIIPVLVNRGKAYAGNPDLGLTANLTHREWIYRQAYMLGRHVIGYELQKIFAAIDAFSLQDSLSGTKLPVGVAGYGEGGMLALYAAALDTRILSTLVSGYFNRREAIWNEPVYRNVFGLLEYFGDARLAVMSWPRSLTIAHSVAPELPSSGGIASPGVLTTPSYAAAKGEFESAQQLLPAGRSNLVWQSNGQEPLKAPFATKALNTFMDGLFPPGRQAAAQRPARLSAPAGIAALKPLHWLDTAKRQEYTVREMTDQVQMVLRQCISGREKFFWDKLKGDTAAQAPVKDTLRRLLWDQFGRLPVPTIPANARARVLQKTDKWTSYIVKLDVWEDVYAWGVLVIPAGLVPGEKRPVVVCQHGLEHLPFDLLNTDTTSQAYRYYKALPYQLAARGYITYMPANPYRGEDKFRMLQRKANPLGLSMFSFIIGQHQRLVEWLQQQPFTAPGKIGFFGLSYGGTTALRVPAIVKDYQFSICVANFNDWVKKCVSVDIGFSYMYNGEYEIQDWDLGHTFNTAEMAALIAPRPFMAQRGSFDPIATDDMVGSEFARLRRHYALSGLPDSWVQLTYFVGQHVTEPVSALHFIEAHLKK
jgi:dienelactone hydrolase